MKVYVYVSIYICIYIYMYMHMYICMGRYIHTHIYIYLSLSLSLSLHSTHVYRAQVSLYRKQCCKLAYVRLYAWQSSHAEVVAKRNAEVAVVNSSCMWAWGGDLRSKIEAGRSSQAKQSKMLWHGSSGTRMKIAWMLIKTSYPEPCITTGLAERHPERQTQVIRPPPASKA